MREGPPSSTGSRARPDGRSGAFYPVTPCRVADTRNATLAGLMAPDITLPDLAGVPHTLSALRGKKVLLTTWASW